MKNHIIVISKKHRILVLSVCAAIVFALLIICNIHDHQVIAVLSTSMWKIEPETPRNIDDPPFGELPSPTETASANEVIQSGTEIPLQFAYDNPEWKRQAYKSYWHSSTGRWSYVPNRIHYAMHQIFVTYPTASIFTISFMISELQRKASNFRFRQDLRMKTSYWLLCKQKLRKLSHSEIRS